MVGRNCVEHAGPHRDVRRTKSARPKVCAQSAADREQRKHRDTARVPIAREHATCDQQVVQAGRIKPESRIAKTVVRFRQPARMPMAGLDRFVEWLRKTEVVWQIGAVRNSQDDNRQQHSHCHDRDDQN